MLERVMGLSAHFAAWLGFALPARALHSLPGAGKGVTGAFSYPPFESPQFQFQQKYPPIREDISVGAGNGTPGGTGAVPPPARGTEKPSTGCLFPLTGTFPSNLTITTAKKQPPEWVAAFLAEQVRFELTDGFRPSHDFQSCPL